MTTKLFIATLPSAVHPSPTSVESAEAGLTNSIFPPPHRTKRCAISRVLTDCPAWPPVQSVTEADGREMNVDGNPSYSMCKEHPYSCSTSSSSHGTSTLVAAVSNGAAPPGSGHRIISLSIATFQSTTSKGGFVHSGIGTT